MASIASVYVDVLASTAKIADQLEAAFRRVDPIARRAGERWGNEIDRGLAAGRHEVKLDADTSKAEADIDKAARDREATIEVDVDAAAAEAKLDRLARDRRIELRLDIDSATSAAGGGGGGVGTAVRDITIGAAAATAALGTMGAAGATSVGSIASQFGQTAGAVGSLGVEITGIASAIANLASSTSSGPFARWDMQRNAATMGALAEELGKVTESAGEAGGSVSRLGGSMGGSVVRIAAMGTALAAIIPIAAAAAQALLLVPAAIGGIGAGIGTLMVGLHGIGDAFSAVSKANASFGADQTSKANAVAAATRTLTSAVRSETQAQKDVARARKDAGRELEDLNDKLRDGTLNEAQAKLDLEKAQEHLANGMFETSTDYKQAQLDVLQAEQRVTEAHKGNTRIQQEAVEARKKGVEGSDAVVAAKERETAAHESVAAAQKAVDDANAKVSASSTAAATAMAALSPNAQALVYALQGIKPAWDALSKSVQDALTAGMGVTITQLANTYLPMLQAGMENLATVFNQMFGAISTELMKPETMAQFQTFLANVTTAMQNLAPMMGPLVTAFSTLMADGSSFLPGMATAISNAVVEFSKFITEASKSGQLKVWMHDGLEVMADLVGMVKALGGAFMALAPLGKFLADRFEWLFKLLETQVKWLSDKFNWLGGESGPIHGFADSLKWLCGPDGPISEPLRNAFKVAIEWIEDRFRTMVNGLIGTVNDLIDGVNHIPGVNIPRIAPLGNGASNPGGNGAIPVVATNQIPAGGQAARRGDTGSNPPPSPAPPNGPAPAAPPGAQPTATQSSGFNWDAVAAQESSGNWSNADTGHNGHYGGLQFSPETWKAFGGEEFADRADHASREQQIIVADRTAFYGYKGVKPQGLGAWEAITTNKVPGVTANTQPPGAAAPAPAAASASVPSVNTSSYNAGSGGFTAQPYGLPTGTDTGGYSSGIPQSPWATALGQQFGVVPSTYSTHQETNRSEAGFAPNPQNLNRGIDWTGTPAQMRQLAEYLMKNPQFVEQLIYWDEETGKKYGIAGGKDVSDTPYYDYPEGYPAHRGHAHTRQSQTFPGPGQTTTGDGTTTGPAGTAQDPTYVALSPNIPAGQKGKEKDKDKKSDAEKLGQDLMSGVAEAFGFDGSLFKNPAEFGLVKIFAALSKLKLKEGKKGSGTGEPTVVGPGQGWDGQGGGGGGLLSAVGGMIPNIPAPLPDDHLQPTQGIGPGNNGQGGPVINNNINMSNSSYGYSPNDVGDQIQEGQRQAVRQPLRNVPAP